MKVKSFVAGTASGLDSAISILDKMVEGLGEVNIHSLVDTVYQGELVENSPSPGLPRIVRVVVYSNR